VLKGEALPSEAGETGAAKADVKVEVVVGDTVWFAVVLYAGPGLEAMGEGWKAEYVVVVDCGGVEGRLAVVVVVVSDEGSQP
jgi:Mn-containing catalase